MRNRHLTIITLLLFSALPASACIWDRDTLAMEKAKFPDTVELIAGYFPRHSEVYYKWRRDQLLAKPINEYTPDDFDDLGVSYDKLGEHQKAINTMLAKVERYPYENLYETHANLGTFYIHNGDLEQGVQYIGSAIEINPDAHFGREVYQKLLVEYVLQQRQEGNTLPLNPFGNFTGIDESGVGFAAFVIREQEIKPEDQQAVEQELEGAIKGVLGMMRFGNYDSPILLEALGDLLNAQRYSKEVQRLATRAYLKASYEAESVVASEAYREKAKNAVGHQENETIDSIENDLKREIAKGDTYFEKIRNDEQRWIEAGKDVDALFVANYYDQPELAQPIVSQVSTAVRGMRAEYVAIILLIAALGLYLTYALIRQKKATSQTKSTPEA